MALTLVVLALLIVPISANGSVSLSGTTNYYTYAIKGREVLQDVDIPAEAELNYLDGNEIELVLTEYVPDETRITPMPGTLGRRGRLKLWFPDPVGVLPDGTELSIIDIVEGHTGCTVLGNRVPTFYGFKRGDRLLAYWVFVTRCDQEWPANDLFEVPVDGLVFWRWTYDLTVDP